MKCLRKKIDGLNHAKPIAVLGKGVEVARQRRRVAGDVKYSACAQRGQVGFDSLGTRAGRIEHDLAKVFSPPFQLRDGFGNGGTNPANIINAIFLRIELAVGDRRPVTFDRDDFFAPLRDRQSEITAAAVELEDAIAALKVSGGEQHIENASISFRVNLHKDVRV